MSEYQVTWITHNLAVGHAPMSYAELDDIKAQGIDAIVNLCGEFCDLHEIEQESGFEVYYLPIADESAPDMAEMEKGLHWLDEAIYLGKKILVHCRHGIGRTGTFVTAYLLRRGLGMKMADKILQHTKATPANYSQWRFLKKYGKSSGKLTIREPQLENRHIVDLSSFFSEYEAVIQTTEEQIATLSATRLLRCGIDRTTGCHRYFEMQLIEAIYLNNKMNKTLTSEERGNIIEKASGNSRVIRRLAQTVRITSSRELEDAYRLENMPCPLLISDGCRLAEFRPISCRLYGLYDYPEKHIEQTTEALASLSRSVFLALSGTFPGRSLFRVSFADTISGRFIQTYFNYLSSLSDRQ